MKKLLISLLLALTLFAPSAEALSTYTSVQTGHNPVAGSILQTDGSESNWIATSSLGFMYSLITTNIKTSNYTANANEFIPVNTTSNDVTITLPNAPADGTLITIDKTVVPGVITVTASGTDKFNMAAGNTSVFLYLRNENFNVQYQASTGIWLVSSYAAPYNFATGFPGIDAMTPITNANISINTSTNILTITPTGSYFNFFVDGGGKINKFRKTGAVNFPAFTDTSGVWYFYFDSTGTAVTTQTPWTGSDFSNISTVYRIVWNSTLVGGAKLVAQYIEYHQNTIPAETHRWEHAQTGTIWMNGFTMANNALVSGAPNTNGANTVIALSTGTSSDENLPYTVTNSTSSTAWNQDLGNITPASLNSTNSALFQVFTQDGGGNISFLPATRYPFAWNSGSNRPETISATGVRTVVPDNRWFVYFVYATQNPVTGEALKVISAPAEFTSLVNAQSFNWVDIQNTYPIIADDNEIRPLYRVIFYNDNSGGGSYPAGCKYSVIRETQDLRKSGVTSTTASTGSLPASSVTFVPYDGIGSTNVQSAIQELADEKLDITTASTTYAKLVGGNAFTGAQTITGTSDVTQLLVKGNATQTNSTFEVQSSSSSPYFKVTGAGNVGIGTTAPTARLNMVSNDSSGYFITDVFRDSVNAGGFSIRRARGTSAAPTTLLADDVIGINYAQAIDTNGGTTYYNSAITQYSADANHGAGSTPGRITFLTTPASSTTAVERMRITSGGLVGIGMTPTEKLDVAGKIRSVGTYTSNGLQIYNTSTALNLGFVGSYASWQGTGTDDNFVVSAYGTKSLILGTGSTTRVTIKDTGNVGIGTVSPSGVFHIKAGASTYIQSIIENTNGGADAKIFDVLNNGNDISFRFINDAFNASNTAYNINRSGYTVGYHAWYVGSGTEMMRLGATGLGVGTNNVEATLDVVGTMTTRRTSSTNVGGTLNIGHGTYSWQVIGNQISGGDLSFKNPAAETVLYMSETGGKVGIGGTPNANAILDVQSTTKAVMLPRVTTTQRDAIASPTESMLVYNLTTHVYNFYNGTNWLAI